MATRSGRLLMMLSLLQARRDWAGEALADRLGVSPRTVRRDVDRLRELGYPIHATKGPDGGYRLDAGADLPPLLFDDDQAVALAVALRAAVGAGVGIEEGAARALATVRQVMPARLRHRVAALDGATVEGRPGPTADPHVLIALGDAIRAGEVLRFDHQRPGDDGLPARRRVEPHHLLVRRGRWYLVAWDLDRDDWRTFRADRIVPLANTGPRFPTRTVPGGDVAAYVAGVFRGGDGPGDWPCRGEVVLHLPADEVAPFAGDGTVEAVGPDRCRLTAGAWSWTALAAQLGRFDTEIEVVGPPELADACQALADRYTRAARPT